MTPLNVSLFLIWKWMTWKSVRIVWSNLWQFFFLECKAFVAINFGYTEEKSTNIPLNINYSTELVFMWKVCWLLSEENNEY